MKKLTLLTLSIFSLTLCLSPDALARTHQDHRTTVQKKHTMPEPSSNGGNGSFEEPSGNGGNGSFEEPSGNGGHGSFEEPSSGGGSFEEPSSGGGGAFLG